MIAKEILQYFFKLLHEESGLLLDESKKYLLETRLEPLAAQEGFRSIDDLGRNMIQRRNSLLRQKVVDAMTTNETLFFRDKTPFSVLKEEVIPKLMKLNERTRSIRIWCAACSTGQEPYSVAMTLREMAQDLRGWRVKIVATDIAEHVLRQGRSGRYSQHEVQRGLPTPLLVRYFSQVGANWDVKPEIKSMVEFRKLNLLSSLVSMGTVDVAFCRNILIYFDVKTKRGVVERIGKILSPEGVLFLGGSESLLGVTTSMARIKATKGSYYQKNGTQNGSRSAGLSELKRRTVCQT